MKSSNIGGQAVMEGVMMKNGDRYAVAVRKPNQEIEIKVDDYKGIVKNKKIQKIPIIRGVFNFLDSLILGMKTLMYSSSFFLEEDEEEEKKNEKKPPKTEEQKKKSDDLLMGVTVAISLVMSVAIFMILPYFISNIVRKLTDSAFLISLAEGIIRIAIFLAYIILISRMKDIQRVFMYHGAEHKCINCIEHGLDLTVENVRKSSKHHKRCGTSFLLIVMVVSIILFMFIRTDSPVMRVVYRLLLLPVVSGISYEFIRLAGNSDNKFVELLSKPGMMLQRMTTKEPDDTMIEVGIASVEAVFDWKKYLSENFGKHYEEETQATEQQAEASA
ncbi:MAG: DUF1385 domain-containing protein [Lachnospiraceae bacterium]|nr:DUF1385 domain-containing protein [Robinsoniella sp.]MDY3767795.1 DUF1385 domain-containing protein [Lachnospiraceae bacterium]